MDSKPKDLEEYFEDLWIKQEIGDIKGIFERAASIHLDNYLQKLSDQIAQELYGNGTEKAK